MLCYAIVQIHSSGPFKAKAFFIIIETIDFSFWGKYYDYPKLWCFLLAEFTFYSIVRKEDKTDHPKERKLKIWHKIQMNNYAP